MSKVNVTAVAAAIALAFSAGALAAGISKADYQAGKANIATAYQTARAGCDSFAGNAKDVCVAEARGKQNIAMAELAARYKPTFKTRYNVGIAGAESNYTVAMEKCDEKAGNGKDVCVREAKAAQIAAKADARAQLKTAHANAVAGDKSAAARTIAATDKRKAEYAVAREKCEAFAHDAKTACVQEAKARFGRT